MITLGQQVIDPIAGFTGIVTIGTPVITSLDELGATGERHREERSL